MKVKYAFICLAVVLAMIGGCGNVTDPDRGEVAAVFTENGYELTSAHVYVGDYQQGKRADITFLVTNNTGQPITAEVTKIFNIDPENDSKLEGKGYVAVPSYYADWVKIPRTGEIAPGRSARRAISRSSRCRAAISRRTSRSARTPSLTSPRCSHSPA